MPRRRAPKPTRPTGLARRGTRAYWHRRLPAAVGGDRLFGALGCEYDSPDALARTAVLNAFWDRGDWAILKRWASGDIHISRLIAANRDGDYSGLKRLNADGVLLGKATADHLEVIAATKARQSYANARSYYAQLVAHFGADCPMHAVTSLAAGEFLRKERENGEPLAPRTQKNRRELASTLWRWVIDREQEEAEAKGLEVTVHRNPWAKAVYKHGRKRRPQVLSEAEIVALIKGVWGTPACALIAIGALAGLRAQEIENLRLEGDLWLDADPPFIRVQSRSGEGQWDTKTERSEADVEITPELVAVIREHIRRGFAGSRYLFRGQQRDDRIHPSTGRAWVKEAFTRVGLKYGRKDGEGLTIHSLRHSHATILLSKGISIATVAERLRDSKEMVLSTYSHVLRDDRARVLAILREAARGIDTAVGQNSRKQGS